MNSWSLCILFITYAISVLTLLDCGNGAVSSSPRKANQPRSPPSPDQCPRDMVYSENFKMKMALCRPNISVVCVANPTNNCFENRRKLKATAYVNRRNGQCLIESNVTSEKTLRFYVEAKRIVNPNAEGSRSMSGQQAHQKGKCLLKYVCQKRIIRSITMECGSVIADENGNLSNFTRQRKFWVAPPNYKGFVHFSAEMAVTNDKQLLNISSAKLYVPGMEQEENTPRDTYRDETEEGDNQSAEK